MYNIVVGCDPGSSGAIAFLDVDTNALLAVHDIPIDKVQVGKHMRSRINRPKLLHILYQARGAAVFTERPEARPMRGTNKQTGQTTLRQPGAMGMMTLGENYGTLLMGLTAAEMALTEVRPGIWKKAMSVSASKDDARRRAEELFPYMINTFARKMDSDRAEAAILGLYGIRVLKGNLINVNVDLCTL